MKLHRKIEHCDKVFNAQELDSYAQGQGSLAVFKVTARDQGHHKGPLGAFVTYCNISCLFCFFVTSFERHKVNIHISDLFNSLNFLDN